MEEGMKNLKLAITTLVVALSTQSVNAIEPRGGRIIGGPGTETPVSNACSDARIAAKTAAKAWDSAYKAREKALDNLVPNEAKVLNAANEASVKAWTNLKNACKFGAPLTAQ